MKDSKQEMKEGLEHLFNALNNFSHKEKAEEFFKGLINEHRTLQQNFWRSIAKVIQLYSETKFFDLRNEDSIEWCKKVNQFMEDNNLQHFNHI